MDLQDLSAVFNRLDSLEQQLHKERQDKAALRADLQGQLNDERRKNEAQRKENQLQAGQIAALQAALHEFSNKTEANVQKMSARLDQCETDTHPFIREMERRRAQAAAGGPETVHFFRRTISAAGHISGRVDESNGGHRLLNEEGAGCSSAEISRQIDAINVECCDEPTEDCSGGHVRTCNAGCGALIVPLWTSCRAQLGTAAKVLQDAVTLCPPPDVSANHMDAQMFMVTCPAGLPANDCIPLCEAETHGFLLLLNIDGTDTTLTCSLSDLLYSWVGAAALGGFLGRNVQAFVSAVISGAAGTYVLTLMEDADVGTDLTIQPGQNVIISGDAGLTEAARLEHIGISLNVAATLHLRSLHIIGPIDAIGGAFTSIGCHFQPRRYGDGSTAQESVLRLHDVPIGIVATITMIGCEFNTYVDHRPLVQIRSDYPYDSPRWNARVDNCTFSNRGFDMNTLTYDDTGQFTSVGAAIHISGAGTIAITNSIFTHNVAEIGGAIYHEAHGLLSITGCTFAYNFATHAMGGAIAMSALDEARIYITNTTFTSNALPTSNQMYLATGSVSTGEHGPCGQALARDTSSLQDCHSAPSFSDADAMVAQPIEL
eukprot:SAG22_NODE_1246_length_5017_cov_20.060175_2_plen_602_part_00